MSDHETAAPWLLPYPDPTGKAKLGATDFKELAERLTAIFKEKLPIYKAYAAGATLKSGEWADQTKSGETFTFPAVGTANQCIITSSAVAEAKLTTAAKFVGGGLSSSTAILTTGMVAIWQSDGTNWRLIAGEVKQEQTYPGKTARAEATEFEPSATRRVQVTVLAIAEDGVSILGSETFLVNPGQKWKAVKRSTACYVLEVGAQQVGVVTNCEARNIASIASIYLTL